MIPQSTHTQNLRLQLPFFTKQRHSFLLTDSHYSAKLARTEREKDEILQLRFKVFNLELKEGLNSSYSTLRDEDAYDAQCDHILITDNRTGEIVGTYRLQTLRMAQRGKGFYSYSEFILDMLGDKILRQGLELGRACILSEYRNTRVLFLIWRAIARYLQVSNKRYLFGCCSLNSQNPLEGYSLYEQLIQSNYVNRDIMLRPRAGFKLAFCGINQYQQVQIPPLMKMYFRYGAQVVGKPAIDREFKTIDYFMLLDSQKLTAQTRQMFFRD